MSESTEQRAEENKANHETRSEETKETSNADSGCTAQATWGTPKKDGSKNEKTSFDLKSNTQVSFNDEEKTTEKDSQREDAKSNSWGNDDSNKTSGGWGEPTVDEGGDESIKRRRTDEPFRRNKYEEPEPSKSLGLFGLSPYASQEDIEKFLKENIPNIPLILN
ncbi:hypothetical protein H312_03438 [Anncaliia algerae PRA339]|uniref:Uncharacterized protein n=1 Tax=Anncaliia algerae PRA339 TaxID=1288291 RepID=A0A059EW93_9MICR|nr:hypothetical protein H312_03438 [Anncaliia algerae PRA339]